jgi:3-hydroxyacyl-CoA dehydrogenase/3a,7a,12a-trihydroxy-5b-cholest-24-enoyl-CoA hydratase
VVQGITGAPDCTLELSEEDFLAMTSGKADPQQLYMGGKLKISGNVMASMKLGFLKKLDMNAAKAAIAAVRAQGAAKPAAATTTTAPKIAQAPAIADRLASKLAATKSDATVNVQLRIREPDSAWALTLGPQGGSLTAGEADEPSATITIADDDLAALARGQATAQALYQRGKLRVDGDALAAHHLSLVEGVL